MILSCISCLDGYSFGIELYKKRLRFIVFYQGQELACRKEEIKVLSSFFQSTGQGIFQGRIKLSTEEDHFYVHFIGQCIGTISKKEVNSAIQSLVSS